MRFFTTTKLIVLIVFVISAGRCDITFGQATVLMSQASTLYRFPTTGGPIQTFPLGQVVSGMTTVPTGMSVGNMNGGAVGGDVLAVGAGVVYRLDNPLSASPSLTQIGVAGGPNASPCFVGNQLFGIGGIVGPGSILVEWDPSNFNQINQWATGVFGGPGGLVHDTGTTFLYSEFITDTLWEYTIGNTTSTSIGSLPNHDYSGLETHQGTTYASFALPTTGQMVFGTLSPTTAAFNQIAVIDTYTPGPGSDGITGIVVIPEPGTMMAGVCATVVLIRRRAR